MILNQMGKITKSNIFQRFVLYIYNIYIIYIIYTYIYAYILYIHILTLYTFFRNAVIYIINESMKRHLKKCMQSYIYIYIYTYIYIYIYIYIIRSQHIQVFVFSTIP